MDLRGLCLCPARREDILHCLCRKCGDEVTTLKGQFIKKPQRKHLSSQKSQRPDGGFLAVIITMRAQGCGIFLLQRASESFSHSQLRPLALLWPSVTDAARPQTPLVADTQMGCRFFLKKALGSPGIKFGFLCVLTAPTAMLKCNISTPMLPTRVVCD